jgi:drug/metabolite transporter (DMT)-like permease
MMQHPGWEHPRPKIKPLEMSMKKEKIALGVVSAIACEVLFGFSYLFTKRITDAVSPMTLLSWRFVAAFLIFNLCALTGIVKLDLKGKPLSYLVLIAVFQPVLYFIGETVGIKLTTASESGAVIACIPIAAMLFSAWILKEPPTKLQVAGVGVTAAGILLIVLTRGFEATFNLVGYLMLLLAVVAYSLYSVFAQKAAQFTSVEKTYAMIGFGAIAFTLIAVVEHARAGTLNEFISLPFTSRDFLIAVLYLSIGCSVFAFLLYNIAVATIGTNRAASFVGIFTVVSVAAGVFILKERYTTYQVIGTALVLGGVYLANMAHGSGTPEIESYVQS